MLGRLVLGFVEGRVAIEGRLLLGRLYDGFLLEVEMLGRVEGSVEGRVDVPIEGRVDVPIEGRLVDPIEGRLEGRELPRLGRLVLGRDEGRLETLGPVEGRLEMLGREELGRDTLGLVEGFIELLRDDSEERDDDERDGERLALRPPPEREKLLPPLGREMLRPPPLEREALWPLPPLRPLPPPMARTSADAITTTRQATAAKRHSFFMVLSLVG